MKTIFFLTLFFITATMIAQQKEPCCGTTSTEEFAKLSSDKLFASAHADPLPSPMRVDAGTMVSFETPDGKKAGAYEVKSLAPTNKVIFMIHEWWGLNSYIKQEAEKLQKELGDVNVYALDLYDGNIATNQQDAAKYMGEVKDERAKAIIAGLLEFVGKDKKIAAIGWCFGGGWSLQAALLADSQAAACVMYYGMPEKNIARLKTLHCDVLGIFGKKDGWISPKIVDEFKKNMTAAGKKLEVKMYDADHAFANPSNPKFDKAATADAHAAVLSFLKERLQ